MRPGIRYRASSSPRPFLPQPTLGTPVSSLCLVSPGKRHHSRQAAFSPLRGPLPSPLLPLERESCRLDLSLSLSLLTDKNGTYGKIWEGSNRCRLENFTFQKVLGKGSFGKVREARGPGLRGFLLSPRGRVLVTSRVFAQNPARR